MTGLDRALHHFKTKVALGKVVGLGYQNVQQWDPERIPPDHVLPICRESNWALTPHMLRSDLYPNEGDALPPGVPLPDIAAFDAGIRDKAAA